MVTAPGQEQQPQPQQQPAAGAAAAQPAGQPLDFDEL